MKILVVEDNLTDLKLTEQVLGESGHEIISVELAERGLARIKETKPDVVLVDLNLPGMTGLALARRLREDAETRQVPIVAISAYPEKFSKAQVLEAGCDVFLCKPLNTRTLCRDLEKATARKREGSQGL